MSFKELIKELGKGAVFCAAVLVPVAAVVAGQIIIWKVSWPLAVLQYSVVALAAVPYWNLVKKLYKWAFGVKKSE